MKIIKSVSIVGLLRTIFLLIFFVHITSIGYYTIHPALPTIEKHIVDFKDLKFPFIFRLCAMERTNEEKKYKNFGYKNVHDFFLGESKSVLQICKFLSDFWLLPL